MSDVLPSKSYLLKFLESLLISKRLFNKLGFDDALDLKEQILAIFDQGARKLRFDESPTLSGIGFLASKHLTFELAKIEANAAITAPKSALSKEE